MNTIAIFQISTQEDLRFQLDFTNLDLTGRDLLVEVTERSSNTVRATLTLGSGLTLDGTNKVIARYAKASMAEWPRGEYSADLIDTTGGQYARIVPVRLVYATPGRTVGGIANQATVTWTNNTAVVTATGGVGPTGDTGPANTLEIGTVDTLETGQPATASITGDAPNQTLDLGLPKGDTGTAATIAVGDVTTGAPGSSASVTNVGTSGAAVFDFTIPRGDVGEQGEQGDAATISVGAVTTSEPGSDAEVTNVGTSGAAVFDFVIPRGDPGPSVGPGSIGTDELADGAVTAGKLSPTAFGDGAGEIAEGNDPRIAGAMQKSANLSDLADVALARDNIGLGDGATLDVGTTSGTIAAGNDSRFETVPDGYVTDAKVATPATPAEGIAANKVRFKYPGDGTLFRNLSEYLINTGGKSVAGFVGSDATGATGSDVAFATAIAAWNDIIIPAGTWRITANQTWPAGKTYTFLPGAIVWVDGPSVTLTIRGVVKADWFQIFVGSGSVVGIKHVRPEWWGATGDGSTDDAPAINKAIASVEASASSDGGEFSIQFTNGVYALASTVSVSPSSAINWRVFGVGSASGGTMLLAKSSFTGSAAVWIRGQALVADSNADWVMSGIRIVNQTAGSGASVGLQIGEAGKHLNGEHPNTVRGVEVRGFSKNWVFTGQATRMIDLHAVSTWPFDSAGNETSGGLGFAIEAADANSFVGDMTFHSGQTVGSLGGGSPTTGVTSGTGVQLAATAAGATIAGVRFGNFIAYYGLNGLNVYAANGGHIRDIWVNPGCQFEGAPNSGDIPTSAINLNATGAGSLISAVFVDKPYMAGSGWYKHIAAATSSSGSIAQFSLNGGHLRNATFGAIAFDGAGFQDVTISGVHFPVAGAGVTFLMYFKNVQGLTVYGNTMGQAVATINSFIYLDTGCNWLNVIGNNSRGQATTVVNNGSGAANAVIDKNL